MITEYGNYIEDLTNKIFGRLTVKSLSIKRYRKAYYWNCVCSCGNTKTIVQTSLLKGATKSCGCIHREMMSSTKSTHGKSITNEYRIWAGIIQRCFNKNNRHYKRYGGRGVTVCDEWKDSFEQFYKDMGLRPSKNHSIDRINNDGNYCKENCRWATQREQSMNKSNSINLTFDGKTKSICEWGVFLGGTHRLIIDRLRRGWSVEKALSKKLNNQTY